MELRREHSGSIDEGIFTTRFIGDSGLFGSVVSRRIPRIDKWINPNCKCWNLQVYDSQNQRVLEGEAMDWYKFSEGNPELYKEFIYTDGRRVNVPFEYIYKVEHCLEKLRDVMGMKLMASNGVFSDIRREHSGSLEEEVYSTDIYEGEKLVGTISSKKRDLPYEGIFSHYGCWRPEVYDSNGQRILESRICSWYIMEEANPEFYKEFTSSDGQNVNINFDHLIHVESVLQELFKHRKDD